MDELHQRTLKAAVSCDGIGLHCGERVRLTLRPAAPGSGIVFARTDLAGAVELPATIGHVVGATLATTLGAGDVRVGTVEHLLAALSGLGIDNVRAELTGPEVPILDGSAGPFVALVRAAGVERQRRARRVLVVKKPLEVSDGDKRARIVPAPRFSVACAIDFAHPLIGRQSLEVEVRDETFCRELAPARTFGFLRDVEAQRRRGLVRGGSLENALVLDDVALLNPEGLRFPDEFVRHKLLDAIGDLALCGMPIVGRFSSVKSGHAQNQRLVRRLVEEPGAAEIVELRAPHRPSHAPPLLETFEPQPA